VGINHNDNAMPIGEPTMPTAEELKRAEESMTDTQSVISGRRAVGVEHLEDIDKSVIDEVLALLWEESSIRNDVPYHHVSVSGKFDGHHIAIVTSGLSDGSYKKPYAFMIDRKPASLELGEKLFDKIIAIRRSFADNPEEAAMIEKELESFVDVDKIAEGLLAKM